ncbi:MAG: hypothetical protein ABJB12_19795 [Pseudomonadota bacterium]
MQKPMAQLGQKPSTRRGADAFVDHSNIASLIPIVTSALGEDAGLMGAVFAAMDQSVRSYRVVATGERVSLG